MKTMKELRETSNYQTKILYHLGFWDGPISGVCLYNGKKCYFDTIEEVFEESLMNDEDWEDYNTEMAEYYPESEISDSHRKEINEYRIYGIFETPNEVIEIIDENHKLFQKWVGTHTNYDDFGKRPIGGVLSRDSHKNFYEVEKKKPEINKENWKILNKFVSPF